MKNVIFKLKFNHPNLPDTPKLNENHFNYICKRARAMYNEGKNFCCFGKVSELGYNSFGNIDNFKMIKNHIKEKSKNKTIFYKCIISLAEEDAIEKGFNNRSSWEALIKNNSSKIAKQFGIKIENFEYICSIHMEKGHPHIHFMIWDKNQEILKINIPKDNLNNIRNFLTNYIFGDDFYNLNIFNDEYDEILKELQSLDIDLNKSKVFNIKLEQNYIDEIFKQIYLLKENFIINLQDYFISDKLKNQLTLLSKKIINENIELNAIFIKYINSSKKIINSNIINEKYINKNIEDIESEILDFSNNLILQIYKELNNIKATKENIKNFENEQILTLVSNLMDFLNKFENKNINIIETIY